MSELALGQYRIRSFELEDVGYSYSSEAASILDGVRLTIPMGEVTHVTGPSGQGQSTLLKLLSFLTVPTAGRILINDVVASEMSFEEFLPWRLEIGYTFENGGLLSNRTLEENLMLPHLYHNLSDFDELRQTIHDIAKRFRFQNQLDRRPALVSGGLRKLITILRPVLLRPSFLVMDDPFSGLDPDTGKTLELLIGDLRNKNQIETICFTSRDEVWPGRLGARALWVENGKAELRGLAA